MKTVQQKDVNDNRPVFQPFANTLMLRENAPPAVILTVEATDRDQGVYGQVPYYLDALLYSFQFFSILLNFFPFPFHSWRYNITFTSTCSWGIWILLSFSFFPLLLSFIVIWQ